MNNLLRTLSANKYIKYFLLGLSLLPFIYIICHFYNKTLNTEKFQLVGFFSFGVLALTMFIGPLVKISPNKFFMMINSYRRQLGIFSAMALYAHILGLGLYYSGQTANQTVPETVEILNSYFPFFNPAKSDVLWGILAFICSIPAFLTSNNFSQKKLGKKWKIFQRFSYGFFTGAFLHMLFANFNFQTLKLDFNIKVIIYILVFGFWIILKVLEYKKIKFFVQKKPVIAKPKIEN